jgi:hypothetical protein
MRFFRSEVSGGLPLIVDTTLFEAQINREQTVKSNLAEAVNFMSRMLTEHFHMRNGIGRGFCRRSRVNDLPGNEKFSSDTRENHQRRYVGLQINRDIFCAKLGQNADVGATNDRRCIPG